MTVIDDFAHNPEKVTASLETLKAHPGRLLVMFQLHGYGPTRFLKEGLISAFAEGLEDTDLLLMPEIYFAGGTAQKDISARDLVDAIARQGYRAEFVPDREAIARRFIEVAGPGDRVVVMGARDDTLAEFARGVVEGIGKR